MGIESDKTYIVVNGKSGTVLDLTGTHGHPVVGWSDNGGDNQKWHLEHNNNQWTFRNVGTGRYLGLAGGDLRDDLPVQGVEHAVPWDIWPDEQDGSVFRIFVPGTPFNVDLTDFGNPENGTCVAIWGKWADGRNQTWRFCEG
ncbi:hypothetical protein H0H81_002033 [Sphagnurus paluster]|uniref:Ricin B lectin domain-containing protein n=1 Tax=Sphagnurus paluster TaxID=117069 RepID=A0A9P7FZG3_9AGAR|nr:hypothetical protein H0H81_002033 [Sphagnurus paluster]